MTRRTFFEADLHDQKKEEEEKALIQAEEKDKLLQNKKLAKPVSSLKTMPSPRIEHRKGVVLQSSLSAGSGLSGSASTGTSPTISQRSSGVLGECNSDVRGSRIFMYTVRTLTEGVGCSTNVVLVNQN